MHVGVKPSAHGPYCPAHPVHTPVHTVKAEALAVGYRRVMSRLLYVTLILYATGGGNTGIRAYYEPISEPRAATGHTSGHSTFSFTITCMTPRRHGHVPTAPPCGCGMCRAKSNDASFAPQRAGSRDESSRDRTRGHRRVTRDKTQGPQSSDPERSERRAERGQTPRVGVRAGA